MKRSDRTIYATAGRTGSPGSGKARVLFVLKTEGVQTSGRIAKRLGITTMAVRQHLAVLQEEGLVEWSESQHTGKRQGLVSPRDILPLRVGRPARLWRLTPNAYDRFSDRHAELAIGMIQAIQNRFGKEGLTLLAEERTRQQIINYRTQMPKKDEGSLEDRVVALANIRCEEGYMAEAQRHPDGTFRLVENHCSISKAAHLCHDLCGGELSLFRAVLGEDVTIERTEFVLAGDRCCTYQIRPTTALRTSPVAVEPHPTSDFYPTEGPRQSQR